MVSAETPDPADPADPQLHWCQPQKHAGAVGLKAGNDVLFSEPLALWDLVWNSPPTLACAVACAFALPLTIWLLTWFLSGRLFGVTFGSMAGKGQGAAERAADVPQRASAAIPAEFSTCTVVLTSATVGHAIIDDERVTLFEAGGKEQAEWLKSPDLPPTLNVAIDHFERIVIGDPDTLDAAAGLLETWKEAGKVIVIYSAIDPLTHFYFNMRFHDAPDAAAAQRLSRLSRALRGFDKEILPAPEASDIPEESAAANEKTGSTIIAAIWWRQDAFYRELWDLCSAPERLVLFQLAKEGVVNIKSKEALRELERKGLIVADPCPKVMKESFRRFVLDTETERAVKTLERSVKGGWKTSGSYIWPLLVIAGLVLLITQQKYFDTLLPTLGAVAAEIAAMFKAAGSFRGLLASAVKQADA